MNEDIKLILWDFGGVLTKSPLHKFIEYEKKFNITPGTIIKINSHNKFNNAWAKLEKNLINKKKFSELFLKEAKELNIKNKLDIDKILECLNVELETTMVEVFMKLKNKLPFACLTNNVAKNVYRNSNNNFESFKDNFNYVFESSKLGLRKPEEEIYKYVLKVLNLSPKNILFIDDLGINLKPAKKLGFHTYKAVSPKDTQTFLEGFLEV